MKLKPIHQLLFAIIGGCVLGLSFPFTGGLFPLAFVAFVPLLLINFDLNNREKGRFWRRFGLNYLYFVIFNAITVWWIYYASDAGMYMAIFANAVLMTLPFMFGAFLTRQLGENKGLISFLVLWLSLEWCHYYWELSWPWLNLGHFLGENPKLIQWYEYSGVTGGSLWILIINILIYLLVRNLWWRKESFKIQTPIVLFAVIGILFPIISSLTIYYTYEEKEDPVEVVVVQPNIESHFEKFNTDPRDQLIKIFGLVDSKITESTDLVVCPETSLPVDIDEEFIEEYPLVQWIYTFIDSNYKVPWMIGTGSYKFFDEPNSAASRELQGRYYEFYNTALLLSANKPVQIHNKSKLVLGGEKIPFIDYFDFLKDLSVNLGGTSGLLGCGNDLLVMQASGVNFAPLICYESVYGDFTTYFVRKGAEVICVITNDGWWRDTPGYKQHRMFSRIRAIENRRSVVRSANTGISCLIDQKGDIVEEIGWDEAGAIHGFVNKNDEFTFFTKYGDLTGRISVFVTLLLLIYGFVEYIKKRKAKE